jgi:hypothetical protein
MSKHTPGPWLANRRYVETEEKTVCEVFGGNREDAHLIAAAPELLEALKLVVSYDEGNHIDGLEMMLAYSKALDAARAAIAKAEGEKA